MSYLEIRLFSREVLAVDVGRGTDDDAGSPRNSVSEPDAADVTSGQFELADADPISYDDAVYLASRKRARPAIVRVGRKHNRGRTDLATAEFGFSS